MSSKHLYPLALLAIAVSMGCGEDDAGRGNADDVGVDDTGGGGGDADGTGVDDDSDDGGDDDGGTGRDTGGTDSGEDGLGVGELCVEDAECDTRLCFRFDATVEQGICTSYCLDDAGCPSDEFACIFLANSSGDFARICVPDDLCIDGDDDGFGAGPSCLGGDCDDDDPSVYVGADEFCDDKDNDCDGNIDENSIDANVECDTGLAGVCAPGTTLCEDGFLSCEPDRLASSEVCDNLDNDCNGEVDDNLTGGDLEQACYNGPAATLGVGACHAGTRTCVEGSVSDCVGQVLPFAEQCDGIDNDCDGDTDEGNPGGDVGCVTDLPGACRLGTTVCAGDVLECVSNVAVGERAEVCDYVDDDCDGETDEDFKVDGKYALDDACGSCFTDCTEIYDRDNGFGVCDATGVPTCRLACEPEYYDLNGVPDDGCEFDLDEGAVYVSQADPGATDVGDCGLGPASTGEGRFPCATITRGMERAAALGRARVRVADGAYEETVTVVNGISLLGGHRPRNWAWTPAATNTAVRGQPTTGSVRTIVASNITSPTVVEGLLVYGPNATSPGASSYAIYALNSLDGLTIRNNRIFAGLGADGVDGAPGTSGQPGVAGAAGTPTATRTCSSTGSVVNNGGNGGARSCQDPATFSPSVADTFTSVTGGNGGAAECPDLNNQEGGGTAGANGGGAGGPGGWGHDSSTSGGCTPTAGQPETGTPGGNGGAAVNGDGGAACSNTTGTVSGGEWVARTGSNATHGQHGRGGGGGGAGGGQQLNGGNTRDIGGSGGGGGSGGCAGEGGYAGSGGGGSFGIFLNWSSAPASMPQIAGNVLQRNRAGGGGNGGTGGAGGDGGAGGGGGALSAFTGPIYCIFGGAAGGFGSRGGHGGGGGGGCGGNSYDIFAWGTGGAAQNWQATNSFALGDAVDTAGAGGGGGISNNTAGGIGGTGSAGRFGTVFVRN